MGIQLRNSLYILFTFTFVFGQEDVDYNFWSELEHDSKVAFIQGYYMGLGRSMRILRQEASRMRRQDKFWSPPFSHENSAKRISEFFPDPMPNYEEIPKMIDALYESPDNHHISIEMAVHILMLQYGGQEQRANSLLLREQKRLLKGR